MSNVEGSKPKVLSSVGPSQVADWEGMAIPDVWVSWSLIQAINVCVETVKCLYGVRACPWLWVPESKGEAFRSRKHSTLCLVQVFTTFDHVGETSTPVAFNHLTDGVSGLERGRKVFHIPGRGSPQCKALSSLWGLWWPATLVNGSQGQVGWLWDWCLPEGDCPLGTTTCPRLLAWRGAHIPTSPQVLIKERGFPT